MSRFEVLAELRSISDGFEDSANEALNNFDDDLMCLAFIEGCDEVADNAIIGINVRDIDGGEIKGTLSFHIQKEKAIQFAKVLLALFQ